MQHQGAKFPVGLVIAATLTVSCGAAWFSYPFGRGASLVCGGVAGFLCLVFGMALWQIVSRGVDLEVCRAIREMKDSFTVLMSAHRRIFHGVLEMAARGVAGAVAIRLVKELLPNVENGEQQEAAIRRAEAIVTEEMKEFMERLAAGEKKCQKDTSQG